MTSFDLVLDVEIPHLHAQINGHHQPLNPHRIGGLDPLHKYVSNRTISPRGEMKDLRNIVWPNAFRPTSQQLVCVPGPHPRHFARSTVSLHSFLPQAALEVPEVAIRKSRQTKQDQPCINKHTHTLAFTCCFTKSSNLHSTIALCTKISWRKHPSLFPLGPVGFDKWTLDPKRCTYWTWILLHVVQLVPGSYRGA